jgi:hypothetical protein
MTHADLEEWAGRGLTEAQANLLFEQIQSEVDDNIVAHCTNVITDFDFGDAPGLATVPAPEVADEINTNDKRYPIISQSLTYITRKDILEWWDEEEDGSFEDVTDEVASRVALEIEGTIENMLEDRWKDMMLDAIRDALDKLNDERE